MCFAPTLALMLDSQSLVFRIFLSWVGHHVLYACFCITSLLTLCVFVPQCFRFCLLLFAKFFFLFSFSYFLRWYIFLCLCECVVLPYLFFL